ncbi:hypothetical protein L1987_16308 [Smallanthus sonchifolius]|uniref:Uncharacterized protein n=1 Tax=Smallanthus sonchifolius TaxID=185202 RepID=A0ACB9JAN1_9ASTR|nr:hypothetical protein L1987_16308 [Smallanthus sonchifolius]
MEMYKRCGPSVGYNYEVLNRINDVLAYLVGGNGQYFRGGVFRSIQGVAQCVQDLSLSDCQDCLSEANGRLRSECETSTWGDMYMEKCYIRYADQGRTVCNENFANNGNSNSNKSGGVGSKKNILMLIGFSIIEAVGVGTLTIAAKNCCNINVIKLEKDLEGVKKDADSAKSEAKSTMEKAEKPEKKAEEESIKNDALAYLVDGTGHYFRVGVLGSVQGMLQCVQDLNVSDCYDCISEARGRVRSECETSTWGDMYLGKCYIRYADGGFHPIKGIDVVNINDDLHGGTRKSKNIKRVFGIVVGVLLGMGVLGFTLHISVTKVYRIRVKKEVTVVRQREEKAQKEAQAAKEEAQAAKIEAKVAREESELHKSQVDVLSRQRDWYYKSTMGAR